MRPQGGERRSGSIGLGDAGTAADGYSRQIMNSLVKLMLGCHDASEE
jgi:hypothetical protein